MTEVKTKKNKGSVAKFLDCVKDIEKKKDSKKVLTLMEEITGKKPEMWGTSIIGFDSYHYKYASGREGDWFILGMSPRKTGITIYIMPGYKDYGKILEKLGKYKLGKCCLYINKLEDVNLSVLKKIMSKGYKDMKKKYINS